MNLLRHKREPIDGAIPNVWLFPPIFDPDFLHRAALIQAVRRVADGIEAGERVLDVGCGWMPYRSLFSVQSYVGVDLVPHGTLPIALVAPDGRLPAEDGMADVCVCWQVLEHVRDLDGFHGELQRCLGDGGRLFLTTHGHFRIHADEDFWRWTRRGLEEHFADHGWVDVEVVPVDDSISTTVSFVNALIGRFLGLEAIAGPGGAEHRPMRNRLHQAACTVTNLLGLAATHMAAAAGARVDTDCSTYLVSCRR